MGKDFKIVADALDWAEQEFTNAQLFYGHGTDNAWDDAVALLVYALELPIDVDDTILKRPLTQKESLILLKLFQQRIELRIPVPYLTRQAWFCHLPFYVDERVIIPRSPLAELIEEQFVPWIDAHNVHNILDLCCGSACIAIACAYAFPDAHVDALDFSVEAIDVAIVNVQKHQIQEQVSLLKSDLFTVLEDERYDIIISNPPYVDKDDFTSMPEEYSHEPEIALKSGDNGLQATTKILAQASKYLTDKGILIVEVGNSAAALQDLYPQVPFMWLEFERGGEGVFMLTAAELKEWQHVFT